MRKVVATECTPGAIGSYVQDADLDSMMLTSDQVPTRLQTGEVTENVSDQMYQSLENVKVIIESVGLKISDIVKITAFVSGLNDFVTIDQVHQQFFDEHKATYPTRSCVQIVRSLKDVKLEIEAIAARDDTL